MNTQEVFDRLSDVKSVIDRKLMVHDGFGKQIFDPHEVEMSDPGDPNELQRRHALFGLLDKLDDVSRELEYLAKPIRDCGHLQRGDNGRFELNGREFTSGESIEILVVDPDGEDPAYWLHTRIEHDTDYYAVAGHRRLDGLMARYR